MAGDKGLFGLPALNREDFNRLAGQEKLPFTWGKDAVNPGLLDAQELQVAPAAGSRYVSSGAFTAEFESVYRRLVELKRRETVKRSLAEGRPVMIVTDLTDLSPGEQTMVARLQEVAGMIRGLYLQQLGSDRYLKEVEANRSKDPDSYDLFLRNDGPWCEAPQTAGDPFCNAIPDFPQQRFGAFPPEAQVDAAYCDELAKASPALGYLDPMTVVVSDGKGALRAVPYQEHYRKEMGAIAEKLDAAAKAIEDEPSEKALHAYLREAANGFRTGQWTEADRAWVAMNGRNSRFALRVSPDETYWEPCQAKAGFQFWFALVDRGATAMAQKLEASRQELEGRVASVMGAPYREREVKISMPDFIEMALTAGDARSARGAAIGEALPNWGDAGPRAVVMTNYYLDPISQAEYREKGKLLFVAENARDLAPDKETSTANTLFHELTHALGMRATSTVVDAKGNPRLGQDGKPMTVDQALGSRTSTIVEEVKAQTGALLFIDWQLKKGQITEAQARSRYMDNLIWAFGHISQGMFENGKPRAYSQLAAVQVRALLQAGAITIEKQIDPTTKQVVERFRVHYDKLPAAIEALMRRVTRMQLLGDKAAAEAMLSDVATGEGYKAVRVDEVVKRLSGFPKPAFTLKVRLE